MTNTKRWLDELPLGSGERELLLVGKAARPAEGAIDANWQALCAALGTTAISGTFATSAAASSSAAPAAASASAASTKVGASIAVGKAASAGLFVVAAKSLALGVGIGLAVMGAATVVQHPTSSSALPATVTKPLPAQPARRPRSSAPQIAAPPVASEAAPVVSSSGASGVLRMREPGVVSTPIPTQLGAVQPVVAASATSTDEKTASLARQARELAELKRLIDHGSATEALGRLDKNFSAGTASVLSEERDALYVQALARAQRRDEARTFARQFLVRYPHSPYFEIMRQLLTEE